MFPRLPGHDNNPGMMNGGGGPNGFPIPFLFRFPPPFGMPPGNMPPTMMPQLPAAFQMFLESRMKQLEAAAAAVAVGSSPTPGPGQRPASRVAKVESARKPRCLQRPTKQIHLQVVNGDHPRKQIMATLRHTEDPTGLENLMENGEKCPNLTIVCVTAADSTSHSVVFTGADDMKVGDVLEVPLSWQSLCTSTTFEQDANISDNNTLLQDLKYGDEIVFLKTLSLTPKQPPSIQQPIHEDRDSLSRDSSIPTPKPSESTSSALASIFPELCGLASTASPSSPEAPPTMVKTEDTVIPEMPKPTNGAVPDGGYQCERCGKMFSYAYYRDKHLKYTRCVDNGDRRFPCPLCTRSFEKRDRLRIHILHVHENHRPHVCDVCGKSFSQSSSLNKHRRVHSGERPYKCPFCSKCFTASSILRTHIRQHSGEKPFKCAFCGKSFASHAAHDSHVRRTHSDQNTANLLKCNACDKCFDHESHLQFHMQCFHQSE